MLSSLPVLYTLDAAYPGDDFSLSITYSLNGSPVDVSGYTIEWVITIDGTDTSGTVTHSGPIVISLTGTQTADLAGRGTYRLKITAPTEKTLLTGTWVCEAKI